MQKDGFIYEVVATPSGDLLDALRELQAASWSRSWSRVQAARERVRELTGWVIDGPLKAELSAVEFDAAVRATVERGAE